MSANTRTAAVYRTIWRWHFWAGLIVAPFLLILSATGTIYLFNEEINDALSPSLRFVPARAASVPVSRMVRAALAAHPGAVSRIDLPTAPDRPAVVFVEPHHGPKLRVPVDPGTGRVLGAFVYERTLVGFADEMHGSLTIGTLGDRIVELAACWALVLIGTGLFLWWPRGRWRAAGVLWPRLRGGGRRFWRELHGPVGLWTAGLIAFLVVTGLPWAGIEGDVLQRVSSAAGIGYPDSFRTHNMPGSTPMKAATGEAPWTLEGAPMPQSAMPGHLGMHSGHAGHEAPAATDDAAAIAGVDRAVATLARAGMTGGYRFHLPEGPTGVYTAYTYPDQPEGQRTIYVDRYSFRQIGPEVDFADYGWMGRATELGVAIHMGNYFGFANQLLMLLPCLGIWALTISGVAMWWKRRPAGRIGAPPRLSAGRMSGAVAVLIVAGVVLPLFGASLLILSALDLAVTRARPQAGNLASAEEHPPTRG
ncbi:PepSY-associated TM helix domain-containing protein [Sphingomonas aracearum]|uniref:PepSY domain-containing protein n=1 Tax=Sphingomonas aracearum TaxID=2283317 RepID=A0A369VYD9_9SPHN|nr:PepSY domain-containing protein [Sphingomonas aracearum]RDE07416.1 PepSY domain-containing protein [Sphingomonas aracearum]